MTNLDELHRRLRRLAGRRRRVRWTLGYSAPAIAAMWALATLFLVDWLLQTDRGPRVVLLALWVAAAAWAFWRYARPWLGQRETELDMAMIVERHEHIDSDLVAALQFESAEASQWGSAQLEQAVIDQVALRGRRLDVMQNLPRRELHHRLWILAATLAVWAAVAVVLPGHVAAFLNRFFVLGGQHYPTRTHIDAMTLGSRPVDPGAFGQIPADRPWWEILTQTPVADENESTLRVGYGQPPHFELTSSGALPDAGQLVVTGVRSGVRTTVSLERSEKTPAAAGVPGAAAIYAGELPKLSEAVDYQVYLGDAWTDPARIETTQLPVVDVEMEITPPSYASTTAASNRMPPGMRQASVIEGSRVAIHVRSDKPLRSATVKIDDAIHELKREGTPGGEGDPDLWSLDPQGTPLEAVVQPVRCLVQVTDLLDQQLERPIECAIRILADLPPRVRAATNTPYLLPAGAPSIYFGAVDDHALARIWLTYEISRSGQEQGESTAGGSGELDIYRLARGDTPRRIFEGTFVLDVGKLHERTKVRLEKGDIVKVTLAAMDYRGGREGRATSADPLVFQVTDEQGLKMSLLEADQQSARDLKTMIQQQLGIGGESP
jgi:hypothetical protein